MNNTRSYQEVTRRDLLKASSAAIAVGSLLMNRASAEQIDSESRPALNDSDHPEVSIGAERPNILWFVLDTVRAENLSLHGYARETTPYLDKFAERATVYTRAYSTAPWTPPSHVAMFTGLYTSWHGTDAMGGNRLKLDPSVLMSRFSGNWTITEFFKRLQSVVATGSIVRFLRHRRSINPMRYLGA